MQVRGDRKVSRRVVAFAALEKGNSADQRPLWVTSGHVTLVPTC